MPVGSHAGVPTPGACGSCSHRAQGITVWSEEMCPPLAAFPPGILSSPLWGSPGAVEVGQANDSDGAGPESPVAGRRAVRVSGPPELGQRTATAAPGLGAAAAPPPTRFGGVLESSGADELGVDVLG